MAQRTITIGFVCDEPSTRSAGENALAMVSAIRAPRPAAAFAAAIKEAFGESVTVDQTSLRVKLTAEQTELYGLGIKVTPAAIVFTIYSKEATEASRQFILPMHQCAYLEGADPQFDTTALSPNKL